MQPDTAQSILKTVYLYRKFFVMALGFLVVLVAVGLVILLRGFFFSTDSGEVSEQATQVEQVDELFGQDSDLPEFPDLDIESPFESELDDAVTTPSSQPTIDSSKKTDVTHVVQAGDTLWDIAEQYYGDGLQYHFLAEQNAIQNPDLIFVDQTVSVPSIGAQEMVTKGDLQATHPVIGADEETVQYTIKPGDSLWKIAQRELDNPYLWTEIYRSNQDVIGNNPDLIFPDSVIQLRQSKTSAPQEVPAPTP